MSNVKTFIKHLFLPIKCLVCGEVTLENTPLCPDCREKFVLLLKEKCPICGFERCNCSCSHNKSFTFLFYYHSSLSKKIIAYIKHNVTMESAEFLAGLLCNYLVPKNKYDAVVFPPRSKKGLKKYGFDQAKIIAEAVARKLEIPCICPLKHNKKTKEQKLLSAKMRHQNMKGAFLCNAEILSNKRRILLIDDVITTGATVNECSKILVENGAFSVSCAAIARTPTPQKITIK